MAAWELVIHRRRVPVPAILFAGTEIPVLVQTRIEILPISLPILLVSAITSFQNANEKRFTYKKYYLN